MKERKELWKEQDVMLAAQPREKLILYGASCLGHSELIAIILGSGTRKEGVTKLSEKLVKKYGLSSLPELKIKEWRTNPGIGEVRACRLIASLELGRRIFSVKEDDVNRISKPKDVYREFKDLRKAKREHLCALYLNAQNIIIRKETISVGSLNTTRTHPREILYPAIANLALGFVLVHNHPGGTLHPSHDDVEFTKVVKKASELMGIEFYDHVIISEKGFVSLKENGVL
jgi:DNA repair protein RadC